MSLLREEISAAEEMSGMRKPHIRYGGVGTEKVEEVVQEMFPEYKVARFDLDTAKNQKEIDRTMSDFMHQRTNVLIGTQILAKGLDFRNVGLVGIVNADISLNIPDYRASERTYQLVTRCPEERGGVRNPAGW